MGPLLSSVFSSSHTFLLTLLTAVVIYLNAFPMINKMGVSVLITKTNHRCL